mgnify:CR=1 FL=1
MKKRILALMMTGILALGMLTGCGAKDNGGTQASQPALKEEGTAAQTQEQQPEKTTADGEKITLRIVLKDVSPEDPTYQEWLKQFNEGLDAAGIGAQLELVSLQSGTYSENLALLLNSGDIPDIIYFQGGDEEFALNQKILEDLTPYIEKSVYIKGMVDSRPYIQTRLKNYPYLLYLSVLSTKVPVIRTDVLDQCAVKDAFLADPSVDNYYQLMKEAKEQGYLAAYTVAGDLAEINNVFDQAFGLSTTWVKGDSGYIYGRVSDASLEELKFYAKLYKEGLLDNEYANNNWEDKENKFYSDGAAIVSGTQGDVIDSYNTKQIKANGDGAVLTVLPPAKGAAQGYTPIDVSKDSRGIAISALSEHKDLAFEVLEYAASPEGRVLDLLGFEGTHYEKDADGKFKLLDAHDNWYSVIWGLTDNLDMDSMSAETPYLSQPGENSLSMFLSYSSEDNAVVIPSDYAVAWDGCTSVYKEFAADFVMGNKTEADWDAFVKEWNEAGGAQVTEYVNTVLK